MLNPRSDFLAFLCEVPHTFTVDTSVAADTTEYLNTPSIDMADHHQAVFYGLVDTTTADMHMSMGVQDSDDGSTFTNVAAADEYVGPELNGTAAGTVVASYLGSKRYVRGFLRMRNDDSTNAETVKCTAVAMGFRKVARVRG